MSTTQLTPADLARLGRELVSGVRMALADNNPWQPYTGPHGGRGWKNSQTNRIQYGGERPGTHERGHATHEEALTAMNPGVAKLLARPEMQAAVKSYLVYLKDQRGVVGDAAQEKQRTLLNSMRNYPLSDEVAAKIDPGAFISRVIDDADRLEEKQAEDKKAKEAHEKRDENHARIFSKIEAETNPKKKAVLATSWLFGSKGLLAGEACDPDVATKAEIESLGKALAVNGPEWLLEQMASDESSVGEMLFLGFMEGGGGLGQILSVAAQQFPKQFPTEITQDNLKDGVVVYDEDEADVDWNYLSKFLSVGKAVTGKKAKIFYKPFDMDDDTFTDILDSLGVPTEDLSENLEHLYESVPGTEQIAVEDVPPEARTDPGLLKEVDFDLDEVPSYKRISSDMWLKYVGGETSLVSRKEVPELIGLPAHVRERAGGDPDARAERKADNLAEFKRRRAAKQQRIKEHAAKKEARSKAPVKLSLPRYKPWSVRLALQAAPPELLEEMRMALDPNWQPYEGKRGGRGYQNIRTKEIKYTRNAPQLRGGEATEALSKRAAPDVNQLRERLAPHKDTELSPGNVSSAKRAYTIMKKKYGDLFHRELEEKIEEDEKSLAKIPKEERHWGEDVAIKKRMAAYHKMLDWDEQGKKAKPAAKAGRAGSRDEPGKPPREPQEGTVYNVAPHELKVDPARFQFKVSGIDSQGVSDELKQVTKFNPNFAGVVSVWRDPKDGSSCVVNGHHRHELATRLKYPNLAVRYIQTPDEQQARAIGALINIAEGRGTALDAAKFMRDMGVPVEKLEEHGVSLKGKVAHDASILTRLNDRAFDRVARGTLSPEVAMSVAAHLHDPDRQEKLFARLEQRAMTKKPTTQAMMEEMARTMAAVPSVKTETRDLFGTSESEEDVFDERAELATHVRGELNREVNDYLAVASKRRAEKVKGAGNVLDTEANKRIAEEADRVRNVYDKLVNRTGEVSKVLNQAAVEYKQAKSKRLRDAIRENALAAVRKAVYTEAGVGQLEADSGGTGSGVQGSNEPRSGQSSTGEETAVPAVERGQHPATPGVTAGQKLDIPEQKGRSAFSMEVRGVSDGKVHLGYPGSDYTAVSMPEASLKHFVNDLSGKVDVPPNSGNKAVDAVAAGKGEFLGKGDDGIVFKVGKQVVKVSTTVPFQPTNQYHRTPQEASDLLAKQVETSEAMRKAGIPGILPSKLLRHGDKAFQLRDAVEIPEKFTKEQLDEAKKALEEMHAKGYSLNDSVQIGLKNGRVYLYDTGKAAKLPEEEKRAGYRKEDDMDSLRHLYTANNETLVKANTFTDPLFVDSLNDMDVGDTQQFGRAKIKRTDLDEWTVLNESGRNQVKGDTDTMQEFLGGKAGKMIKPGNAAPKPSVDLNDPQALADAVHKAASQVPDAISQAKNTGDLPAWQSHKPLIADVHDAMKGQLGGASLDEFKQALMKAHQAGTLNLHRNDMPASVFHNAAGKGHERSERSQIDHLNSTWHVIDTNGPAAQKKQAPGKTEGQTPTAKDIQKKTRGLKEVVAGNKPVGVEGRGGKDMAEAKRQGLYTSIVNGGGIPGTPEFSRLLGYTPEEIDEYKKFLKSEGREDLLTHDERAGERRSANDVANAPGSRQEARGRSTSNDVSPVGRGATGRSSEHYSDTTAGVHGEKPEVTSPFHAILIGDMQTVQGFKVRRSGKDEFRIEKEGGKGVVRGTAAEIQQYIDREGQSAKAYGKQLPAALARAKEWQEPSFMDTARMDEETKAFQALPTGTPVVSLEEGTHGRPGRIVKDDTGATRVKLDGQDGYVSNFVEPLDPKLSWRVPEDQKPKKEPKAETREMFGEQPALELPRGAQKVLADLNVTPAARLDALAAADTKYIDDIYASPEGKAAGINHNEWLRAAASAAQQYAKGTDKESDKKRLAENLTHTRKRITEVLIPALRKLGKNTLADFYEQQGVPAIEEMLGKGIETPKGATGPASADFRKAGFKPTVDINESKPESTKQPWQMNRAEWEAVGRPVVKHTELENNLDAEKQAIKEFLQQFPNPVKFARQGEIEPDPSTYAKSRDEDFAKRIGKEPSVTSKTPLTARLKKLGAPHNGEDARLAISNGRRLGYRDEDIAHYLIRNYIPDGDKALAGKPLTTAAKEYFPKIPENTVDSGKASAYAEGGDKPEAMKPKEMPVPVVELPTTEYKAKGFRGFGRTNQESIYLHGTEPIFGTGAKYYAYDEKTAAHYGPQVVAEELHLKKPLHLASDQAWVELTKKLGLKARLGMETHNKEEISRQAKKLAEYVQSQGYDGVVVATEGTEMRGLPGKPKRPMRVHQRVLSDVFGHSQVVVF